MDGRKLYGGGSNMAVLLSKETLPSPSELLESFWIPDSSTTFHGSKSVVNFEGVGGDDTKDRPFFQTLHEEENGDEDFEGCFHRPEKKRRLTAGQVQFLERNFEVENKLEPERKNQLAKELGLQPRQVAIWFQNRRARFKTKQLEKDYDSLKASYDSLKADYDCILKEKEKLKTELLLLTDKALIGEKEGEKTKALENISPSHAESQKAIPNRVSEHVPPNAPILFCKQEDASSAKSDVFDSDSPLYTDGNHSSLLEPADSSQIFEPDQSEFSQDEEDNLSKSLIPPLCFPKLEDCSYPDPPANACNLGLPAEEQHFWFWSY